MTANDMELGIETEIHGIIEDNGRIAIDAELLEQFYLSQTEPAITNSAKHLAMEIFVSRF